MLPLMSGPYYPFLHLCTGTYLSCNILSDDGTGHVEKCGFDRRHPRKNSTLVGKNVSRLGKNIPVSFQADFMSYPSRDILVFAS